MKYIRILILLLLALQMGSCIGTKKLTYLQQPESQEELDSLVSVKRIQKPYRVQINDLLDINVKALDQDIVQMFDRSNKEKSSSGQNMNAEKIYFEGYPVDAHGNIRVPTLGKINVLGYTTEEIRKKLERLLLKDYFKEEANLFVTVRLAGIRFTTAGEIGAGTQVLYDDEVTIMEAIAEAGDIPVTGDRKDVMILRQYPEGHKVHHIDLTSIDAVNSPYYYVQPNDLIIVKPLPQKSYGFGVSGLETFSAIASVVTLFTSLLILTTRL